MKRLLSQIREEAAALLNEPTVVICGASTFLILSHHQGSTGFFYSHAGDTLAGHPLLSLMAHEWWFGSSVFFYLVMPLLLAFVTRGSFHNRYGLGLGDWRQGLAISGLFLAVMLPLVWFAATHVPEFKGMYPLAGNGAYARSLGDSQTHYSLGVFAAYELGYLAYFIAWEFLFRGWMVHGLLPTMGRNAAILVQVAPFAIMHFGKAQPETLGAVIAGVALGVLSVRTRSMWYGALIHGVIAVWMDLWSVPRELFLS